MPTIHLSITGKVQGVFYRASAKKMARSMNLVGWVRNTEEGAVEAIVTGTSDQLLKFVDWCRQGPAGANVTGLNETIIDETVFESFEIVH